MRKVGRIANFLRRFIMEIKHRIPPKPLHGEGNEQLSRESWKVFQIMSEFVDGFERLSVITPSVSIFGSARLRPDNPYYQLTEDIGKRLSDAGFSVVSGGGPGIMEAANKGAYQGAHGLSVGLNIELPHEQKGNPYQDISMKYRYFFARKAMFVKYCNAYIVFPGGFGTLDELAEILTLIQTGKSRKIPVILVGSKFWQGLLDWLHEQLLGMGLIAAQDLDLMTVVDDADSALKIIEDFYQDRSYAHTAAAEPRTNLKEG